MRPARSSPNRSCPLHLHRVGGQTHRPYVWLFSTDKACQELWLSYLDGPQSDHRGLFVDIDPKEILGQPISKQSIGQPHSRSLKSGNPELVEAYHKAMLQYYAELNMVARMKTLFDTHTTMSRSQIKKRLKKWDCDQGRAMAHAESII
jgi:hypothetical protein